MKLDIVSREFPVIIKDGHDFSNPTHILNGTAAPERPLRFKSVCLQMESIRENGSSGL